MVLFWDRSNAQSCLSMMDVIDYNSEERKFKSWYHIHRAAAAMYRFERPQCSMLYAAEWKDSKGRSYAAPMESLKPKLTRMMDQVDAYEVELIRAAFNLEANGKVPRRVCDVTDVWLRKAARTEQQCLRALSFPTVGERTKCKKM